MADLLLTDEYGFLGGVGGSCALCNASKRKLDRPERIVTTSLVTDMQNAPPGVWPEQYMEFCESCINEMGHLVGMKSEREILALTEELRHQEGLVAEQAEELETLRKEIQEFTAVLKYIRDREPAMPTSIPKDPPVTRTKR